MRLRRRKHSARGVLVSVALTLSPSAWDQIPARQHPLSFEPCSPVDGGSSAADYRTATQRYRDLVERNHFTAQVEQLRAGQSTTTIGADLHYTLTKFPNHPRALMAMAKLSFKENRPAPVGARYAVDCYFDRAIGFRPDDGTVRMVFGYYLLRKGDPQGAVRELTKATELSPDDMNVHYNLGLAYFDLKDYAKALEHAKRAYELGHPLPGLRRKLELVGKWAP